MGPRTGPRPASSMPRQHGVPTVVEVVGVMREGRGVECV